MINGRYVYEEYGMRHILGIHQDLMWLKNISLESYFMYALIVAHYSRI